MSTHNYEKPDTELWQEPDAPAEKVEQVILGYVIGMDEQSRPLVTFVYRGIKHQYSAITAGAGAVEKGRQVALSFVGGALQSPIILGAVYSPLTEMLDNIEVAPAAEQGRDDPSAQSLLDQPVKVDGKKILIEGAEQVELKCGEASITLTKAGKVLIRGKYLLNRASGVNRIVGGSVQVN